MAESTMIQPGAAFSSYEALPQPRPDSETSGSAKRQKSRHRASVACSQCRERRIRCVVPPSENECVQCKRSGIECVIKNDDERRRPISRAYMSTLTDRVALLECLLKEKGSEPPPVVYPPKTTRGRLHADGDESPVRPPVHSHTNRKYDPAALEDPSPKTLPDEALGSSKIAVGQQAQSEHSSSVGSPIDNKKDGLVDRLLSTRGHLSFDQLSGRLRFYGGTVNCHIYSELSVADDTKGSRETVEQTRRAEKCIRALTIETHDYLMRLFWEHYNAVLHVVHQEAFNDDREHAQTQFYSGFLHVCILAIGYRFADKSRPDMQCIALPDRESTLHREAKYMLDLELERPGGMPSIAALLILGDAEASVGRDNVGWMYAGMAMRLCYDIGLQLDSRHAGLSQREMDVRRMTLWACVIYDRYWSLFLGRPLAMKSVDLEIYSLADQFERLGTCMPAGREQSINTRIYEALIDLMEVAGKIVEQADLRKQQDVTEGSPEQSTYSRMAALDRELHNWATRLPLDLRYTEENRTNAPLSFYLLHQQYHAVLILLHRPFARYDDQSNSESDEISALDSHFSRASRAICSKSAIAVARIFWQHRQRFDGKQIFTSGMQHAGAAATALIAAIAYMPDATDRNNNMQYLEVLHLALQDMSLAYQPAERMAAVLNAVMVELRGGPISPGNATASTRRGRTTLDSEQPATKRRQSSRPSHRSTAVQPPPTTNRSRRPSDAASEYSFASPHGQRNSNECVTVAPRSEPASWAAVQYGNDDSKPQPVLHPTDTGTMSLSESHGWVHQVNHEFPPMPPLPDFHSLPGGVGAPQGHEFSYLPSEEDWYRWHATTNPAFDIDLDSFPPPPQGRHDASDYIRMGGNMNGRMHDE